jgi:ABC-type oligopeptide transport system ATPase subunit
VSDPAPLLEVRNLVKHFRVGGGLFGGRSGLIRAVDGVSFEIHRGETLGLVG